ncbi:MAG: choice-of-anchor J domain-containing protein [Bacteroidetes bacterium]|nr:choice-of-anchor J domain-containing protein [Bacteroidota bacterium]
MRPLFLFPLILTIAAAHGQLPLPYTTGFDNASQQQGWQFFREGFEGPYEWGFSNGNAHSAPTCLWHDYNVGGGGSEPLADWAVSPALDLSAGATLDLWANVYSIMGMATENDRVAVYLLVGSADPSIATLTELDDFTDRVTNTDTWEALPTIAIPPTAGTCHIGLYYRSTTNWFTPGIDDLSVTNSGTGIRQALTEADIRLYPNPVADVLTIDVRDARYAGETLLLQVMDARGALVLQRPFAARATVRASLGNGRYSYRIADVRGTILKRGDLLVGR